MIELFGVPWVVALGSAALMGMAIQRGATCMVAAVDDAIGGSFDRAGALAEAALWVGGLVAVAQFLGWMEAAPAGYPANARAVLGGVLLGLGAWINRACVFGSVARIGSGQWAWLATPVGFFAGCLLPIAGPERSAAEHLPFAMPAVVAGCFLLLLGWRLLELARCSDILGHLWHPHRATLLIGITFVTTMLTVGMWAYTDALAALARPMAEVEPRLVLRGTMVLALLAGAILGGWIAGVLRLERPSLRIVARCLAGGAMMGLGSTLVPGSNDGLIMLGLPLLLPHAWVAVAMMALSIALAISLERTFQGRAAEA